MNITPCDIPGLFLCEPRIFNDERGFFMESFRASAFCAAIGEDIEFVQDNHSQTDHAGTVRGLHFQAPPHAQGKLVRCTVGSILDVAVDIRAGSPTYGQHISVSLSADNAKQLWIPAGFLHGFITCEPKSEVQYKCTNVYAPQCEGSISWDDPDLAIDWNYESEILLSSKDREGQKFADFKSPFKWEKK